MILSWLKTYALQASLIALGVSLLFGGLQTWRLSAAHGKIDEQRQTIVDVKAANLANMATIEALRKANAEWSAKCKAEPAKWAGVIAGLEADKAKLAEQLSKAKGIREVIYREGKDECAHIPVPAGIIERLRN